MMYTFDAMTMDTNLLAGNSHNCFTFDKTENIRSSIAMYQSLRAALGSDSTNPTVLGMEMSVRMMMYASAVSSLRAAVATMASVLMTAMNSELSGGSVDSVPGTVPGFAEFMADIGGTTTVGSILEQVMSLDLVTVTDEAACEAMIEIIKTPVVECVTRLIERADDLEQLCRNAAKAK